MELRERVARLIYGDDWDEIVGVEAAEAIHEDYMKVADRIISLVKVPDAAPLRDAVARALITKLNVEAGHLMKKLAAASIREARLREAAQKVVRGWYNTKPFAIEDGVKACEDALASAPDDGVVAKVRLLARNVRSLKAGDAMPVSLLQEADALLAELGVKP